MAVRDNQRLNTRSTDRFERLRALFSQDWGLKLLALAITLVLWFMVSGRIAEREVAVDAKTEGTPAPAFVVQDVVVTPAKIKVQGPISNLNEIDKVVVSVPVEGRRESFDLSIRSLPVDPRVQAVGMINVHVTIVARENSPLKSTNPN